MDIFLGTLYRLAVDDAKREGLAPSPLVLVALGGYGRGELHPLSDLDLMLIYDGEMGPYVQRVTQGLLYALWDLGLQVGHALRSLPDCLAMARTDFPSRTSMQQARFLVGDRRLFNRFRKVLAENVYQKDFAQFLETTLTERDQRYRKFGGSPYMGEPNVKESAGGLRDIHTAMWLASTKFGTRTLRELADKRLINAREQKTTDEALTFLWRVRNELHFLSGHKNDVLSRDIQPQIAKNFGYAGDELSLPVEKFMRDYYLHARVIHRVSRRLIARCRETLSRRAIGAAARAPGGARRRPHRARRAAPPGPARRAGVPGGSGPPDQGVLAQPPSRLRAGRGGGAGHRGLARPDRRRLPRLGGGARSLPRDLPELGADRADAAGDARARRARPLPARVGRADLPRAVRRLPQVHRRPALADRGAEPGGARAGPVAGLRGQCAGGERAGAPGPADAGHAAARHRQGQGARPRRPRASR